MAHPVELFFHALDHQPAPTIYWVGDRWSSDAAPAFRARGWTVDLPAPGTRLEFLSLPRESREGVFVESLPSDWSGERVQRLLAAVFQGLKPGGVFFVGFEGRDSWAILAWLRQAGFEAIHQGSSGAASGVLARRIGPAAAGK